MSIDSATDPTAEPAEPAEPASPPPELPVRVIRSARRTKSIQARMVDGEIELRVPARASQAQVDKWCTQMRGRFDRAQATTALDLEARAAQLADRYDLPTPASIRWVSNQAHRWGSCTTADLSIRLSDRLANFPSWVVDCVLVHELSHLVHPDHSPAFWKLANQHPRTEEAKGYLTAKSDGL